MNLSSDLVVDSEKPFLAEKTFQPVTTLAICMCALGAIFYCYEYYLRVAPSVMHGELKAAFGLGEAAFGNLVAFYYYAYTPMQIPVGMMMDRFGPRRIISLACLLCALGTYLFAATKLLYLAQFGRFLIGFGSAFAYVGFLKISSLWFPKKHFALLAGLCSALGMLGAVGGEVSMSYLVESLGWQTTLNYAVIVGILLTVILWAVLRDKPELTVEDSAADLTAQDFIPPKNILLKQLSGIKEITLSPQMWLVGIIGCLTFLPIALFAEVWAVSFLKVVGLNSHQAAWGSSMVFLGFAMGGPCWGWLSDAMQSRRIPLMLGSFGAAILMALAIFMPSPSLLWMYSLLFLAAFFAGAEILIFAVSNDCSRASTSATAAAFANMLTMIGGTLSYKIGKSLDNSLNLADNLQILTPENFSKALIILPVGLVLAGILSFVLKESYHSIQPSK